MPSMEGPGHEGAPIPKPFGVRRAASSLDHARVLLHPDEPPADLCHRVVRVENDHSIWTIQLLAIRFHFDLLQMELSKSSAATDARSPPIGRQPTKPTHLLQMLWAERRPPTPGRAVGVPKSAKSADDVYWHGDHR